MKVTRIVACAVIAGSVLIGVGHAQSLRNNQTPAEFPPASYTGTQYVDSRGCVFIRAGIDGNVTWVPRVNRQRRLLCGQTPSLSGTQIASATAARPAQAEAPVQITIDPPAPSEAATATPAPAPRPATRPAPAPKPTVARAAPAPSPKPAPTVVRSAPKPEPAPAPVRTARAPAPAAAPSPAPAPTVFKSAQAPSAAPTPPPAPRPRVVRQVQTATAPSPAPAPTVIATAERKVVPAQTRTAASPTRAITTSPACRGGNAVSQRYINSGERYPVRCGPQSTSPFVGTQVATAAPTVRRGTTTAPAPVIRRVPARGTGAVSQQTRVLPVQVYDKRQQERGADRVPAGFRPAWEDDRLNPRRAEQSLAGIAQTRLVWTQTVPRRLIDVRTGRDVTTTVPLIYPYTDMATQERELGTVTLVRRDGQLMKRVVRNKARARAATVSTRSAPAAAPVRTTRAAPKPKAVTQAAPTPTPATPTARGPARYVQVGTFGVPSNAQATAQRLKGAGLPVRIGALTRGSKQYQIVMAGPFTSPDAANRGLRAARSLGFGDAFIR